MFKHRAWRQWQLVIEYGLKNRASPVQLSHEAIRWITARYGRRDDTGENENTEQGLTRNDQPDHILSPARNLCL